MRRFLTLALIIPVFVFALGRSAVPTGSRLERLRAFTRGYEFDYVRWTLTALKGKTEQAAVGTDQYLPREAGKQVVLDYMDLVAELQRREAQLADLYADPNVANPEEASQHLERELTRLYAERDRIVPVAEAVLQRQVGEVVADLELGLAGQPVPPVLYQSTPLPLALIISPRDEIRQEFDISLHPDLTTEQKEEIEAQVEQAMDVSSLVVQIGGVGLYPTMVQQTSSLNRLIEVVAHEWTHNFLTLRPLGMSYLTSPALRTMNETAASIAGKEVSRVVIERYYPELAPPPEPEKPDPPGAQDPANAQPDSPPAFDFRAEMHATRVAVDQMLADGRIEEAEAYMEQRRIVLWDHGYRIRKLNQAYFAFHGAYADEPGGAAGEDPVGAAVRALRAESASLTDFLNRISWMWSFEQLEQSVQGPQ